MTTPPASAPSRWLPCALAVILPACATSIPTDGTVFPRGLLAPDVMWEGARGDAVYVHIHSSVFDYEGCLPIDDAGVVQLPQEVWDKAGEQTSGPSDPFTVELTVWTGNEAKGPISEQLIIAAATLKGSIYYNSYVSTGSLGGSIYRIPPGREAEVFIGGFACVGCHAVSANGERLVTHALSLQRMHHTTHIKPAFFAFHGDGTRHAI